MVAGKIEMFPVTHGRGSDPQHDGWLKSFSSRVGSLATSRGASRPSDYYWGANGSSMRLAGLEPDTSTADQRAIVVQDRRHDLLGKRVAVGGAPGGRATNQKNTN